jgi:hypothetical protein
VSKSKIRLPSTFALGLFLIALLELLLFVDVHQSHRGAVHTDADIAKVLSNLPQGALEKLARFVAINFTALVWPAYILVLDGLLAIRSRSPIRQRPHHFALLCLASIPLWCLFDWVNFYFIHAWTYIGIPPGFLDRFWGYVLAFACITPGMLLSAQLYLDLGCFDWSYSIHNRHLPEHAEPSGSAAGFLLLASFLIGLAMFLFPLLHPDPITNLTLWTSLVFLLDPINYYLNRPSMWRDWFNRNFARTLALFAGGLTCGLLWEFWNYWSLAKWTYHLPFLGALEHYRYFEMPLPGLLGFLPFGLESWVMWQLLRVPLDGLAEPLPDDRTVL